MKSIFQTRLKQLRKEKKLTESQLGLLTGLHEDGILAYESGRCEPTNYIVFKLSSVLKVHPDYLIGTTDDPNVERIDLSLIPTDDLLYEIRKRMNQF